MNIAELLKWIPLSWRTKLVRLMKEGAPPIWDGIYPGFAEVPAKGSGFDRDIWISETLKLTQSVRDMPYLQGTGEAAILPIIAGVVESEKGRVSILDYCGGMGVDFIHVIRTLRRPENVKYFVVERPGVCTAGAALMAGDNRIRFGTEFPSCVEIDIAFVHSGIQYIEDFKGVLRKLAGCRPRFIILLDLVAGENPTFATAQKNVKGSVIPCWFFNFREIVDVMASAGFDLLFTGYQSREFDQGMFPSTHQVRRARNVIFKLGRSEKR